METEETYICSHIPGRFQKDLIVWKHMIKDEDLGTFGVSEGLNSVETQYTASGIFPHRDVSEGLNSVETFIVFELVTQIDYVCSFRRT